MENRAILSENEKLALITGDESQSRIMTLDGKTADDVIAERNTNKFNEAVDRYVEKFNEHATNLDEFAEKINENVANIEIMPISTYILVKPFTENPFQRIVRDAKSGLILDVGGQRPEYKNTDSGEIEEEENIIKVAVVQEVGPDCKYIKPDDTVMYVRHSEVPIPFYKQGLALVNEMRVLVTINSGLTERFEKLKKNV